MRIKSIKNQQQGFTIVELLIATLIFSVVLLIVTVGIIQISRVYYKGITESNTQNVTRNIADTISQAIQFNGGIVTNTPNSASGVFCVGNQQFSYRRGIMLTEATSTSNYSLLQSTTSGCTSSSLVPTSNFKELVAPKMRLSNLVVQKTGTNLYTITIKVTYGDDDLLNNATSTNPTCKVGAGSQFCSISELTTTVVKRVE